MGGVGRVIGGVGGAIGGFFVGGPAGAAAGFTIGSQLGGMIDPNDPAKVEERRAREQLAAISSDAGVAESVALKRYAQLKEQHEKAASNITKMAENLRAQPYASDVVTMQGAESAMRSGIASAQTLSPVSSGLAAALAARQAGQAQVDIFAKGAVSRMIEQLEREKMVTDLMKSAEETRLTGAFKEAEAWRMVSAARRGLQAEAMRTQAAMADAAARREAGMFGAMGQALATWGMTQGG